MDYSLRAIFGLDTSGFRGELAKLEGKTEAFVKKWGKWAALAAVGAFVKVSKDAIELAGHLDDLSQNLGVNVEAFQALEAQHKRNGVSQEQLTKAMEKTKSSVIEAASGNKKAAQALEDLGLNAAKLIRLPLEQQYAAIAKGAADATDQNKAFSAVADIFGDKVGPKLMGSLKELAQTGLPELIKQEKEAGRVMREETIRDLDRAGDAIDDFKKKITIALGNIIVKFSTEEQLTLLSMQLTKVVGSFLTKILDVPIALGQALAAVLFGVFEAAISKLHNGGIEALKAIAAGFNKVLPEKFEINIGNLDKLKTAEISFGDAIASAMSKTEPTALTDAIFGGFDEAIEKQKALINKQSEAQETSAIQLGDAGLKVVKAVGLGANAVEVAGEVAGRAIAEGGDDAAGVIIKAAEKLEYAMLGARGGAQFNTASDAALQEIVRRNTAKAAQLRSGAGGAFSAAGAADRLEAGRLETEAFNARRELETRAKVRSAFASGGEAGVFRAFPTTDPLILANLIDQFARNQDSIDKSAAALEVIKTGLIRKGIITAF